MATKRQPSFLHLSGWMVDGPDLLLQLRMHVAFPGRPDQGTGPVYSVSIPLIDLATEEMSNGLETAWQTREKAAQMLKILDDHLAQDGLF